MAKSNLSAADLQALHAALGECVNPPRNTRSQLTRPKFSPEEANRVLSNLVGSKVELFCVGSSDTGTDVVESGSGPSPSASPATAHAPALARARGGAGARKGWGRAMARARGGAGARAGAGLWPGLMVALALGEVWWPSPRPTPVPAEVLPTSSLLRTGLSGSEAEGGAKTEL